MAWRNLPAFSEAQEMRESLGGGRKRIHHHSDRSAERLGPTESTARFSLYQTYYYRLQNSLRTQLIRVVCLFESTIQELFTSPRYFVVIAPHQPDLQMGISRGSPPQRRNCIAYNDIPHPTHRVLPQNDLTLSTAATLAFTPSTWDPSPTQRP